MSVLFNPINFIKIFNKVKMCKQIDRNILKLVSFNRTIVFILFLFTLTGDILAQSKPYYKTGDGIVEFVSDAPLELISAKSNKLKGILSVNNLEFAFEVAINSFIGFNSPLQNEHFLENYMQADDFPTATFTGSIIEIIDFDKLGLSKVRAKGNFKIHGVEQMMILDINLNIKEDEVIAESEFDILLEDYQIKIPKIVNKKIANSIHITVHVELK